MIPDLYKENNYAKIDLSYRELSAIRGGANEQ